MIKVNLPLEIKVKAYGTISYTKEQVEADLARKDITPEHRAKLLEIMERKYAERHPG